MCVYIFIFFLLWDSLVDNVIKLKNILWSREILVNSKYFVPINYVYSYFLFDLFSYVVFKKKTVIMFNIFSLYGFKILSDRTPLFHNYKKGVTSFLIFLWVSIFTLNLFSIWTAFDFDIWYHIM